MLVSAGVVYGQEGGAIEATVTQLAGQNVYLNAGQNEGVAEGDTLRLISAPVGRRFLVIRATRSQAITAFVGAPFALTRGQKLTFVVLKGAGVPEPVEEVAEAVVVEEPEVTSIMETPDTRQPATRRATSGKVKVDGRLLLSASMLASETRIRSSNVAPVRRQYVTPVANLSATISNLPSDFKLNVQLRSDYRYQSRNPIAPENSVRAYRLNLEKTLPFGQVQIGRFYNRLTQRGGYWDGVSFLAGSRKKGIGASVGYMPDRSNEGFSTQFPRYSVFAHYETPNSSKIGYRASVAFNEIQPSSVFLNHRYAGIEQRLNLDGFTLNQDLQIDQDPISKSWIVSHFHVNTRIALGKRAWLRGRYSMRQPYRIYNIDQPFLIRRDQYSGGLSFQLGKVSFGGNVAFRMLNQNYEGQTFSGYFNTRPLTRLAISLSGSGSYWTSDFGEAIFLNGGLARSFGKLYARVNYGFYQSRSPNVSQTIDMHRISVSTTLPINKTLRWNLRASANQSQFTTSLSLHTSLQIRF